MRGGQATLMNFSLCLIITIIIIITSSLLILLLLLFLLYYVRLDTGFTILRNVHVLWVRAPLSKQVPQASNFSSGSRQRDRQPSRVSCPTEFFVSRARPLHDAPPSRCAFKSVLFTGQRVFAHGGEDGSCFAGLLGFVARASRYLGRNYWAEIPGIHTFLTRGNEREISSWTFTAPALPENWSPCLTDSAVYGNSDARLPRVPRISLVKDAARGKRTWARLMGLPDRLRVTGLVLVDSQDQTESAAILKIKESMQEEAKRFEKDSDHPDYFIQ